jgi:uncharacterized protein YndB with AHSA1/START domain
MNQIEQTYTINAPVEKVWLALTDAAVAEAWGAAPAEVNSVEGGEFSYWDSDVHGFFTKIVPLQLIEQDWFGPSNPGELFKVQFTFGRNEGTTIVQLVFSGEIGDSDKAIADWRDYYFDPIKKLLEQ